ncbi:MAG TPA: UDP-N-acetylglucosamine 2-epimerase (non-hydrolyzing), partial [Treponemataceae bacterium]|nr:UDP-N-acetylglucosamine 2-epimerase (non-hydrolyzing) [Treponemataceae bacterium]
MKILTIVGARPQFIKAAVLSRYIKDNPSLGVSETLVHTGQHYDQNMSDVFFDEMHIPTPDINLRLGSGLHGKMTGKMLKGIEEIILDKKPDILLVYGDTNSTLAGALAASKIHIPVAHVEAGLRSYMMAMPEEQNRRLTDNLSTWLFCPTQTAIQNLSKEGIIDSPRGTPVSPDNKRVSLTGDIMYEASLYYRQNNTVTVKDSNFILLTIHRAENTDDIARLTSIVSAVNQLSDKSFVFPVHPRTKKILAQANLSFGKHVKLIDPVGYYEMLALEAACDSIVTDSGGVQKEAFFFKKPCITLRDSTEWVELVENNWNALAGANEEEIVYKVRNIQTPSAYPMLYG